MTRTTVGEPHNIGATLNSTYNEYIQKTSPIQSGAQSSTPYHIPHILFGEEPSLGQKPVLTRTREILKAATNTPSVGSHVVWL